MFINYQLCEIKRAGTLVMYVFCQGENNWVCEWVVRRVCEICTSDIDRRGGSRDVISCISYIERGWYSRRMCDCLFLTLTGVDAVGRCVSFCFLYWQVCSVFSAVPRWCILWGKSCQCNSQVYEDILHVIWPKIR